MKHEEVGPVALQAVGVEVAVQLEVGVLHLPFQVAETRKQLVLLSLSEKWGGKVNFLKCFKNNKSSVYL